MANECVYYYYDHGYCCELRARDCSNSRVDDDTVHRYCWGYHYDDCPRYRAENRSSYGCFLTSACTEARGLPDDCHELTTLRAFRDGFMKSTPLGRADIQEYYHIAPKIVAKIRGLSNAEELFDHIYMELVLPCVDLIENNQNDEAYRLYKHYVQQLKERFAE